MSEHEEPEDQVTIQELSVSPLEASERAQVDIQVSTAKQYPRSLTGFKRDLLTAATLDQETAESMFYTLPRAGKSIQGPSARFAEVALNSWGNVRAESGIISTDDRFITARASVFDLEKNVAVRCEVRRRITDRSGKTFGDDMQTVAGNAAISIALRNAALKVIPQAFTREAYLAARKASTGSGTITQKRKNALTWFERECAVEEARVLRLLGKRGLDDIDEEDLITLRGLKTAISQGDTTIEQAFAESDREQHGEADDAVNEALGIKQDKEDQTG